MSQSIRIWVSKKPYKNISTRAAPSVRIAEMVCNKLLNNLSREIDYKMGIDLYNPIIKTWTRHKTKFIKATKQKNMIMEMVENDRGLREDIQPRCIREEENS